MIKILGVIFVIGLGLISYSFLATSRPALKTPAALNIGPAIMHLDRPIMITNGLKHSVPLNEIIGGGPAKDGIPPIDNPQYISGAEGAKLYGADEPGLAFSLNAIDRFYPFQVLVWHEIVNDTFAGQRALITYCPLCRSGIVFDPLVKGERVAFGTSGKLWNSNLVMYDRATDSYWSQILGEAIAGEMTGARLAVLPSDITKFGLWWLAHPNGEVLSRETSVQRAYGVDPYGNYYTTPDTYFPVSVRDDRLANKDFVLGLAVNGRAKAYLPAAIIRQLAKAGEVKDSFAGITIVARYEKAIDAVRLFKQLPDGTLTRLNPVGAFWFSWAAAHPNTELLK